MKLHEIVMQSAQSYPNRIAVKDAKEALTYQELNNLANKAAWALKELGINHGDRVAIWIEKSIRVVTLMQAILRIGAAYVPIDPFSPSVRARKILQDCQVKALISNRTRAEELLINELENIPCFSLEGSWQGFSWDDLRLFSSEAMNNIEILDNDLAYILYTSGSTGHPKGVCISHKNAMAFIEWAKEEIASNCEDRFSNHAPFHFDLSVMDLYVCFLSGGYVSIISESISYVPIQLIEFLKQEQITVWYSVPSVLILMLEHGNWLEIENNSIKVLLFAGEPFPIKYLRSIRNRWPAMKLLNLYGPTETNVCTFYEVHDIPVEKFAPMPIGKACCGNEVWAVKADGTITNVGEEGELVVSGPTVMLGYWGQPPQENNPYFTGDIVRLNDDKTYSYIGRRDHMVKIGGHRVELGDIEAVLLEHPSVREAVVILSGTGLQAKLIAFIVSKVEPPLSLLEFKRHCAKRLPRYMIIDEVRFINNPPRTSTGKFARNELTKGLSKP